MDQDIAARVRVARTAAGLTQEELARDVGVTLMTVNRLENGRGVALLSTIQRIAARLGVSIDWLATGDGKGPRA